MARPLLRSSSRFGPARAAVPGRTAPAWMFYVLALISLLEMVTGGLVIGWPSATLGWLSGASAPATGAIPLWQCLGLVSLAMAVGFWIAAGDPIRHWPVVLVGLLFKAANSIGFVLLAANEVIPWSFGQFVLVMDVVWLLPLLWIVRTAITEEEPLPAIRRFYPFMKETVLQTVMTHNGDRLLDLSEDSPLLVVFLRHSGCTFCREAQSELAAQRAEIERTGTRIVLAHMSDPSQAEATAASFGLPGVDMVSDPERILYWAFGLRRGGFAQLFGPKVVWRGFVAGILRRLGVGGIEGDSYQMPGAFLFTAGRVERHYYHESAADRPNYVALARPSESIETSVETQAAG